jgi:hypothetical protein
VDPAERRSSGSRRERSEPETTAVGRPQVAQHVEIARSGAPGGDLHACQCRAIEHEWERPRFVVAHAANAQERSKISQGSREPFEVVGVGVGHQVDVLGQPFGAVEPGGHAADDQVLDTMSVQRFDDAPDIENW